MYKFIFKMSKIAFFFFIVLSCSSIGFDQSFTPSKKLLEDTKKQCNEMLKTKKIFSKKKCLSLLNNKKILVRLREVSDIHGIVLRGETSKRLRVWCNLTFELQEKLKNNPDLLKIDQKLWVRGEFSDYNPDVEYILDFFTLNKCEFTPYGRP